MKEVNKKVAHGGKTKSQKCKKILSISALKLKTATFSDKLCVTEKITYVNKLKFKWFCSQYPLINYLQEGEDAKPRPKSRDNWPQ